MKSALSTLLIVVASFAIGLGVYASSGSVIELPEIAALQCDVSSQHDDPAAAMQRQAMAMALGQDQEQGQPETNQHCERPNPKNPDVGGKDPKKVGCKCVRTCQNGNVIENPEPEKKCKSHCHKDHCDCPDPCKT